MKLSLKELGELFPNHQGHTDETIDVEEVFIDSRKSASRGIFVPIVGERFDGHDFLKDAIYNGAIASLWQEGKEVPRYVPNDFPILFVKDTTNGLQTLAKHYLKKVKPTVIGITGSNGKTTTKDLVYSIMSRQYKTHKTDGNFNNHIGLPLTVLAMPEATEVLILEMGMNHFGEISLLSKIAEPDFGVITNIGESHIEYLGSRKGIAKAKMEMKDGLKQTGKLIIDGDEPLLTEYLDLDRCITCGIGGSNDIQLSFISSSEKGIQFELNQEKQKYHMPLLGHHNAKNAAFAIAIAKQLQLPTYIINKGLQEIELSGMRLERYKGKNDSLLINDAYNASPTSMCAAIETLKSMHGYRKKVAVLGDMFELGSKEEELHRSVANVITSPITDVITIGKKAWWIFDELERMGCSLNIQAFTEKHEALSVLENLLSPQTAILFKASRGAKLETLIGELKDELKHI